MKHRWIVLVGLAATTAGVALGQQAVRDPVGGQQLSPVADRVSTTMLSDPQRYRLRPGDSFDVDFTLTPEFNQTVSVQPDGYGSLKGVGTIPVEGKTIPELTETIRAAYGAVLHNPLIVILLKDFDKPYFIATGQVARPGKYDLRSELTVSEALAIAGGVSDKAKISKIVLYRRSADGEFVGKVVDLKKLLAARNLSEDQRLKPGDLLYVPQNISSRLSPYILTAVTAGAYYAAMYHY